MLNKAPIFVNGFQRGGTNILMQLISSHPQIGVLGAEVHELFYGRDTEPIKKWFRRLATVPVVLNAREHTFWAYRFQERRPLASPTLRYIDLLFYLNQRLVYNSHYQNGAVTRTRPEREGTRIVGKCVNGVVLTTPILAQMYPDATFIALVRNGLALCEGFMRRGWSAERGGRVYQQIVTQMVHDAAALPNYHIIRFEDLLHNPATTLKTVYDYAGLDINETKKFKLQAKKSMGQDGQRTFTFGNQDKAIEWYALDELSQHLRQDVNENQIARLSQADKNEFLREADDAMSRLGYLTGHTEGSGDFSRNVFSG